jgi:hypothetical protein
MPGLDPGIHRCAANGGAAAEWIAGSSPAMTEKVASIEPVIRNI